MKRCSTCQQFFPVTMFGPDKRKRDGLQPQCRICRRRSALKSTKTGKGKETVRRAKKRYRQTAKGQEKERQYKQTEKYKEAARLYARNYRQRDGFKDKLRKYQQATKFKEYNAQYWKIEKNKQRMKDHSDAITSQKKASKSPRDNDRAPRFAHGFKPHRGKRLRAAQAAARPDLVLAPAHLFTPFPQSIAYHAEPPGENGSVSGRIQACRGTIVNTSVDAIMFR